MGRQDATIGIDDIAPEGEFVAVYGYDESPEQIAADLEMEVEA